MPMRQTRVHWVLTKLLVFLTGPCQKLQSSYWYTLMAGTSEFVTGQTNNFLRTRVRSLKFHIWLILCSSKKLRVSMF